MMEEQPQRSTSERWLMALQSAKRADERWCKRGKRIVRRFRDERLSRNEAGRKFNILWSNIQTMLPALYGRTPRAQVDRRFKDADPVARTSAQVLERVLQFEIDHHGDYDFALRAAVLDRLLPGRGVVWVRFETKEVQTQQGVQQYECTPVDYVFWEDFRCTPARNWEEVEWVARRVYMSRAAGVERFGEQFKTVPLTHEPIGFDEQQKNAISASAASEELKKAEVWEIWDKARKEVIWVCDGCPQELDRREDPYGLEDFFPCPKPLFATQSTETIVPVPDFALYQDQADEIDELTQRIGSLVQALKVVGVYDSTQDGVQRMLSEGVENTLIPVDSWATLSEKGGVKGVVDWFPLDMVIGALGQCYEARERAKQVIYEVTGLSDIIRGASVASETATAQQIKSEYASLRLKRMQTEVAQFASEILRIKAQLICDLYQPQMLAQMSGIGGTADAQYLEPAIQLLKAEAARNYRIEVASDSLVEMNEATEKQSRMELLTVAGKFMRDAMPVVQARPELMDVMGEMLLFGVRSFRAGRTLEASFEQALAKMAQQANTAQSQQQDPAAMQAQADVQMERQKMQQEQALEQFRAQQAKELEAMKQQAETQRMQFKAQLDAQTKLEIAAMTARAAEKPALVTKVDGEERLAEIGNEVREMAQGATAGLTEAMQSLALAVSQISQAVMQMNAPKRRIVERGADGKATGVIEVPA